MLLLATDDADAAAAMVDGGLNGAALMTGLPTAPAPAPPFAFGGDVDADLEDVELGGVAFLLRGDGREFIGVVYIEGDRKFLVLLTPLALPPESAVI